MAIPLSLLVITKNSRLGNNVVFTAGVLVGIGMEVLVISFFVCEEVVELSWEQADAMNSNMMITNVDFIIK